MLALGTTISSCNLNATNGGTNGSPDSTAKFKNVSSQNLPPELKGNTQKAKAADFDGDGDFDLVLAIRFQPNGLLINNGTGVFSDEFSSRLPTQNFDTQDVSVADFNGDGAPDIIFVSGESRFHELYINDGTGNFADLTNRIPVTGNSTTVTTADINDDGPIDIAIGNLSQNFILINNGNVFFTNQTSERIPLSQNRTRDIKFEDVTGDNLLDIVIASDDLNRLLVNTGSGFFTDQTNSRLPLLGTVYETKDIEPVDVDGDGSQDIYFANTGFQSGIDSQDRLLINNGLGEFSDQTEERLPELTLDSFDADFSDLDNDRDPDLVIGNYNQGIHVLINDGNGVFTDETETWIPEGFTPPVNDVEIALFNDDRLPDIYISVRNEADQLLLQRD